MRRNLRTSILAVFSVLLFLSFALVGGAFNIAVNQYISSSAGSMLSEAREAHYDIFEDPLSFRIRGRAPNFFRTNLRLFTLDTDTFEPIGPLASYSAYYISAAIKERGIDPVEIYNFRLRSHDYTYFISSATVPGVPDRYTIYYVDVSDLQEFTRSINVLLLSLAGLIWLVSVAITGILAGTLARPLHILRAFALRIGQGDFTPSPISFMNEEFEALNQSLNHTAKQLAKYDNDQKTFFQNVSHELRTPLMTIESYAEGIKYGIMEAPEAINTILDATGRLSNMVDDVLYISRIDNITMPAMERCDLKHLIQERIGLQRPLAELRGLQIDFDTNKDAVVVNCATNYISRALDNLISNAIRFADSVITLECKLAKGRATIVITDDGPGFEAEVLPHVFERFYKGKSGLTGIGLSVVRSIVEQHKGTAMAENCDSGAKLTISIPVGEL